VPVPAAASLVDEWRRRLDPSAAWGVPPHVSLLYPFVPPAEVDIALVRDLTAIVAAVPAFRFRLESVGWFGDRVLWLAPEPAVPFKALVERLSARWPEYPPYGGDFSELVPHLTIGENAPREELEQAAGAISARLPVRCFAGEVWLMTGSPDSWALHTGFALGDSTVR
jgi:2'-5' RNA ligase